MKPEDIDIYDWQRIFIGNVPAGFYLEVIFRTAVVYLVLMVSMRLMGKRMASQLSRNEMVAMVSLAAAIGVPLQSPDRGILAAVVIAIIVVFIQQVLASRVSKNQQLETITQGDIMVVVEDGRLNLGNMKRAGLTRERTFSQLRGESIKHLGEVKRLYFEAGGSFSIVKNFEAIPGLGVLPEYDERFKKEMYNYTQTPVCKSCGQLSRFETTDKNCENCGSNLWAAAVL